MCNSIAEGGGRCAAHIEAEMKNHKDNYNWEVIKSASEEGIRLPVIVLDQEDEKIIRQTLRSNQEHQESLKEASDAISARNREFSKYSFVLSTKDEGQVARYLYESSDAVVQGKIDGDRAQKAYETRLLEIDYNAKAQEESGVERQEARTPVAAEKLKEATRIHAEATRNSMRAEDRMMASMRDMEAMADEDGEDIVYDQKLIDEDRKAHETFVEAENNLKWAQREALEAEDFDRRNFHAVFNPEAEREKAKRQRNEIMEGVRRNSAMARSKAMNMAPYAITAYRNGDKSSLHIPQGPEKGKLPEGLRRAEEAFKQADAAHKKTEDLLQKKARREITRDKLSQTPEFKGYAEGRFMASPRALEYAKKSQRLSAEFGMTEKYEKQLLSHVEKAKAEGRPYEMLEKKLESIRRRRASK